MDMNSLLQLSGIADLIHQQNSARLKDVQEQLTSAKKERVKIMNRPGDLIPDMSPDAGSFAAQTKWSNSTESALPLLDEKISRLEHEIKHLVSKARASFTRVKGLEHLTDLSEAELSVESEKQDETAREALISLRTASDS